MTYTEWDDSAPPEQDSSSAPDPPSPPEDSGEEPDTITHPTCRLLTLHQDLPEEAEESEEEEAASESGKKIDKKPGLFFE